MAIEGKSPWRRAVLLPLAAVWLTCTAINVGKAAHVDDSAHLEIAAWIAENPLHPMQGEVAWGVRAEPIHHLNQPHLFFYLLALVRVLCGPSLVAAQLLVSLFVALAIASFHGLWRELVGPRGEVLAPALLFLGPAFVPGQNVMTDAPLLGLWLAFAYLLVQARGDSTRRNLVLAASVASAALLVKYTSLVLLPLLALDVWRRGPAQRSLLAVLAIPLGVLGLWSLFNVWDYGGVHLLERPLEVSRFGALEAFGITLGRGALWIVTLGACVPFALVLLPSVPRRALAIAAVVILVLTVTTQGVAANVEEMRGEGLGLSGARALFFVVGVAVLVAAVRARWVSAGVDDARALAVLRAWALVAAVFVIVLSPFVAVRHVLLALPPLMLIVGRAHIDEIAARPRWIRAASVVTITVGVLLGISDRRWAETYRQAATRHHHEAARGLRTFWIGHWGWQWHAAQAGLLPYQPGLTELRPGDRLVRPALVDQPPIDPDDRARMVVARRDEVAPSPLDLLRTTTDRLGYYSVWQGLPYVVSTAPVEVFEVLEVRAAADAGPGHGARAPE